ncbi:mechanosensitive ion channel family protein [Limimaricola sp. AA108-03]|uniref:mechanosensitive ion channel family protein n=1 Tax=Limimaricola sp. AA108-03 TaxID=3425945 RepID=UPI003D7766CD
MLDRLTLPFDPALLPQFDPFASLLLLATLWIARKAALRAIRARSELPVHEQRRLIASSRNLFLFLTLVGLVLIWAPQLRTFALSLTAVAVAIVVATKELILCLSGAVLRATTRPFSVGDWIEVGEIRGEVTDHTLLATTVQEFGAGAHAHMPTGRTIVMPNSMLLVTPVRNQTALREHAYHHFAVTLEPMPKLEGLREKVAGIVQERYEPFRERAARANAAIERRTHADLPDPAPTIRFRTTDLGKLRAEITLFCPLSAAEQLESEITWHLLTILHVPAQTTPPETDPSPSETD